RDSIFKNAWKGKAIITRITLRLTKRNHILRLDYGAIKDELAANGISDPTPKAISDAVVAIRKKKLPDPAEIGNSGSFFKNPVVNKELANELKEQYSDMPTYAVEGGVKIAAGWLIEQAGWKGFKDGDVGVHKNQALVLVNYGSATGAEVLALSHSVINSVHEKFGILLQAEVNLI
ncbi:UDP-N-acetylenolpyruvoylglucosamine reductase, partial [Schleiferiaceae bacterium]|nr:UDP-N-acetylenolpyruvoylglucosamine reductase [Schleiferiaceae bacterium]